jgi:Spy/CpxP family protein refolding chaperone
MKLILITVSAISVLSLGSSAFGQDQRGGGGGGGSHHGSLERTAEQLNLTPDQKAKVQPIIDQATPQTENIRREAMQKTRAVVDNAIAQMRPLLTPEQQKKLEDAQNDRRGGRGGRGGHHRGQGAQDEPDNG